MTRRQWRPAFYSIGVMGLLLIPVTAVLADHVLATVFNSPVIMASGVSLPILTEMYRDLGTGGLYGVNIAVAVAMLGLGLVRANLLIVFLSIITVTSGVLFNIMGLTAALIAYIKICWAMVGCP